MSWKRLDVGVLSSNEYDPSWWRQTLGKLQDWSQTLFGGKAYTTSNVTESRTFDASSATLDETRQVLGTLIDDLRNGRLPE